MKKHQNMEAWEAFLRGLAEGSSLGFSGELAGVASGLDELGKRLGGAVKTPYSEVYQKGKKETQSLLQQAEAEHPGFAYGGQVVGALAVPVPGGAAANAAARSGQIAKAARIAALGHAATGAISGIGKAEGSPADFAKSIASESAASAVAGGAVQRYSPQVVQQLRAAVMRAPLVRGRLSSQQEFIGDIAERGAAKSASLIEPALSVDSAATVDNQSAPSGVDVFVTKDPTTGQRIIAVRPKK